MHSPHTRYNFKHSEHHRVHEVCNIHIQYASGTVAPKALHELADSDWTLDRHHESTILLLSWHTKNLTPSIDVNRDKFHPDPI